MKKEAIYHYYVEGDDEKSLLETLKRDMRCIKSGKVDIFNVVQNRFTVARIRPLKPGTIVVLVYDTDVTTNMEIIKYNVAFLKKQKGIKDVICIPQVNNLEDELISACNINSVEEITKSSTKKEFKSDIKNCSNLASRLCKCDFDITKLWSKLPQNEFLVFGNDAKRITIDKR